MSTEFDSSYYAAHPPQEEPPIATQLVQRFLQLAGQLDALQAQVGRLASTMAHEREQIDVLLGHLGKEPEQSDPLQERLVELTEQMSADHDQFAFLSRKLTELATQDQLVRLATVVATQRQVMDLGETIQELTRAQQRTNELTEARGRQVTDILSTVQSFLNRRSQLEEQEIVMDAGRLEEIRREARGEFAALFLPAIDGLEGALEEGRVLLARHRQDLAEMNHLHGNAPGDRSQSGQAQTGHPQAGSLVHRLRSKLAGEGETPEAAPAPQATPTPESMAAAATATALNGWLRGLALVRDRFLTLMAQEGIQPIQALRQPFDPRLHVIVQSEQRTDLPPNTIVREIRRGFRQDNRVLRFAEVVVARAPTGTTSP
ncbi:MAG: nucleotide exchange factor GrpE [Caldilineaceae bacterium]|nr:nucleotide exchange factor GrpE [Caldilineaceae bacterium]